MFIFLLVVAYLSAGLVFGSASARVGYSLDRDVRGATRGLEGAKKEWEEAKAEFEVLKRTDDGYYNAQNKFSRSVDALRTQRTYAESTYQKNRQVYMGVGGAMIIFWPVGLAGAILAGVGYVLYKLGSKALLYALNPAQYDDHNELLKGTM